jgi:HK97 gp10 family phage protein
MSDSITIDTKEVDRLCKVLGTNRDGIVRRMAFQIEGEAKQLAPYDTTAMRNSIYTETSKESGFSVADSNSHSKNPKVTTIQHPKPDDGFANVGPSVDYAAFVELGTSRQQAQPFLVPAAESVAQKYNSGKEWEELTK